MLSEQICSDAVSVDCIRNHIQALEGPRHPQSSPEALERAADYIFATLAAVGCELSEHRFPDNGREFRNVIATRRGHRHPEQRVVVIAHYDTVPETPGADDNASGVAVLLELARILQPLCFERTIHFIGVSLEENARKDDHDSGTRGSRALAAYVKTLGWQIEGVVVLESVAFAGESVVQSAPTGIPIQVPKVGDFIAVVGNESSAELVCSFTEAVKRLRLALPHVVLTVPGNGELLPDSRRSDHAPFWDLGYKAIMVTDTTNFRSPHYHRPSDTIETLNLEFAANVCRATGGLILELARPMT
jgi:Zn-dependent M28 family amino/carboxypeptidase